MKIVLSKEQEKLYAELRKLGKRANQRIVRIERAYGEGSWGIKQLRSYLDTAPLSSWTTKGRVSYRKSMSEQQMKITLKFVKRFLNYKTSTVRGIKKVRKEQIEQLQSELNINFIEDVFTMEDAEDLYDIINNYDDTISEIIPPSVFKSLIREAVGENFTKREFINKIGTIIDLTNNKNIKEKASRIYDKFIKPHLHQAKKDVPFFGADEI